MKKVKDNFQAFLVDDANFVSKEEYPFLEKWMISKEAPSKILPFNKIREVRDIRDYYICFYCRDEDFKRVANNPKKYIKMFLNCKGIIGLDFSVHTDMPIIKQKSQMNKNLSLTYFFAKSGVSIIPNIRYGVERTKKDFLKAIPKKTLIAFGTYGFIKTNKEKDVWLEIINDVINLLEPKGIIIYGSLPKLIENWIRLYRIELYVYPSYKETRMKEVKANGN